jgi:hypothetical protein
MNVTDPIADMLTRIRNASVARHRELSMPSSRVKREIARILADEGFIEAYETRTDEASVQDQLVLALGYSHPVEVDPPAGIEFRVETPTRLSVFGADKELVGQTAAYIRAQRKPEPYKGKGIRYAGEQILRKAGKAGKVGG